MGDLVSARCECGYKARYLRIGGGKAEYRVSSPSLASCDHCRQVVAVNVITDHPVCPICGGEVTFYPHDAARWRFAVEPTKAYRCPKCGQNTLVFTMEGHYD